VSEFVKVLPFFFRQKRFTILKPLTTILIILVKIDAFYDPRGTVLYYYVGNCQDSRVSQEYGKVQHRCKFFIYTKVWDFSFQNLDGLSYEDLTRQERFAVARICIPKLTRP
jgi:hypothetical protein